MYQQIKPPALPPRQRGQETEKGVGERWLELRQLADCQYGQLPVALNKAQAAEMAIRRDTPAFVSWSWWHKAIVTQEGEFSTPLTTSLLPFSCLPSNLSPGSLHNISFWVTFDLVIYTFIWTIRYLFWGLMEYVTHTNNVGKFWEVVSGR